MSSQPAVYDSVSSGNDITVCVEILYSTSAYNVRILLY